MTQPPAHTAAPPDSQDRSAAIRAEIEATGSSFHALLDSLTDEDLRRQSHNPGWTNGEVLFHIVLAFILVPFLVPLLRFFGRLPRRFSRLFAAVLDAGTGLFNVANGLGPRLGSRVFSGARLGALFDRTQRSILQLVASTRDEEWERGMYYPSRWEPLFGDFMTLEDVVRYPTIHFRFHVDQLSR